jgi:hypothetical protein
MGMALLTPMILSAMPQLQRLAAAADNRADIRKSRPGFKPSITQHPRWCKDLSESFETCQTVGADINFSGRWQASAGSAALIM